MLIILTLVALICGNITVLGQETVIIDTTLGPVQGRVLQLHDGKRINTFHGLRYAKAPVGALRWQLPEDPDPWTEPFVADEYGSSCPQSPFRGLIWVTQPWWRNFDEDCLNMNVYAPSNQSGAPYPTMIFIHGGGYQTTANIQYPGHFLAAKDVVVVVPNYRLGILGFATTGDEVAPGNYGMHDQLHVLHWIQDNIGAFGGDPTKVTVFGESAGAASTGLMLVSPLSEGLIHQAILESGSELAAWAYLPPAMEPERFVWEVAEQVNCSHATNNQELMDCLREVDEADLRNADINCTCLGFSPIIDGIFLTDTPTNLRAAGQFAKIPEIIGINRDDASIFVSPVIANGTRRAAFEFFLGAAVALAAPHFPDPSREEDVYEALLQQYSPWPHLDNVHLTGQALSELATDFAFGFTMDVQIKMHTEQAPTYQYVFDYVPEVADRWPEWMGCTHTFELPYVFGYPLMKLNDDVRNQTGFIDLTNYTTVDFAYADYMITLWTNFAKIGQPTPIPVDSPISPATVWQPFTWDRLNTFYIGNLKTEVEENYRQLDYSFWHSYLNWMVSGDDWPLVPPTAFNPLAPASYGGLFNFLPYSADMAYSLAQLLDGDYTMDD